MDLYHNPDNLFVAGFLGAPSMNFLIVDVIALTDDHAHVHNPVLGDITIATKGRQFTVGQQATLGLRPQYLSHVEATTAQLSGHVTLTERLGSETVINATLSDGTTLIAAIAEDKEFRVGAEIGFRFDTTKAHLFPELPRTTGAAH